MGSLCSKSSTHSGGHVVLGGGEAGAAQPSPRNETAEEARERRLRAIEERQRKDTERLTNKANPNAGRLASQLNKPYKPTPSQREEEPLRAHGARTDLHRDEVWIHRRYVRCTYGRKLYSYTIHINPGTEPNILPVLDGDTRQFSSLNSHGYAANAAAPVISHTIIENGSFVASTVFWRGLQI